MEAKNQVEVKKPEEEETKHFWQSKTFWGNFMAVAATVFAPDALGAELGTEEVAIGFGVLNLVLRFVTKMKMVF